MEFLNIILNIITVSLTFNIILAAIVVFFERKKPVSTWAWLMVILFIPVFGFIIYLFFGQDGRNQKLFLQKQKEDEKIFKYYLNKFPHIKKEIDLQKNYFDSGKSIIKPDKNFNEFQNFEDLANMHLKSNDIRMTYNNKIKLFHNGEEKFKSLLTDIKNAKNFIHIEYYIIKNDELGKAVIDALTQKALEGVEVKLIYDSMGGRSLTPKFFKDFKKAGGKTGIYLQSFAAKITMRLNYRNHRKIAVIDGNIGYIGGFNIGNEYLGFNKKLGYWRDTHMRVEGNCVDQLELRFMMDWNFVAKEKFLEEGNYFPSKNFTNGSSIQIVSSGPDTKLHQIKHGYFKMINEAEKNIYIVSPYFVPDDSILEAIKIAALSGLDVRVLIPGKPDHPFVYWANLSYAGELLNSGVRFYQYNPKCFIHSKLVMIDGLVCSIGTANMDVRSFSVNFEANAFIYDKNVTSELEKEFLKDLENSTELTIESYSKRSFFVKLREAISRLISPIL